MELAEERKYPLRARSSRSFLVGEEGLHPGLGIVKIAVDGAHAHVVPLLGLHLQGLDRRDAVLGIKHQDFGPVHVLETLQGGLARVTGGGDQDAHRLLLLVFHQGGGEQVWQHLQGHILEGRSGAMPQLQAIGILRQGFQRRHPGIVKLFPRVAGLGKGRQLLLGEILQNSFITATARWP